ncbi:hypothetical protein HDU82_008735 [Entophlyctis luteolus]|nr:hypothetical protein HDU82_008735 [Entophlyctis luteolus]
MIGSLRDDETPLTAEYRKTIHSLEHDLITEAMALKTSLAPAIPPSHLPIKVSANDHRLLQGQVSAQIHEFGSKIVRLFISSTFTDMKLERDFLLAHAFDVLSKICSTLGLVFQPVDMRWGIPEEAANFHTTVSLCLSEVKKCFELSVGPAFVCMIGDKYGYRPIPGEISEEDYSKLTPLFNESSEAKNLFHTWYTYDLNAVPPRHFLLPVKDVLQEIGSSTEKSWQESFWPVHRKLQSILEGALGNCISVTERELNLAIELNQNTDSGQPSRVFCFERKLEGLRQQLSEQLETHSTQELEYAARYIDLESGKIDMKSQLLMDELKEKINPTKVFIKHSVSVKDFRKLDDDLITFNGLDILAANFCCDFINTVGRSILEHFEFQQRKEMKSHPVYSAVLKEITTNLKFVSKKISTFVGRDSLLAVETSTRWKSGDAVVETMAKDMPGIIENYFYNLELKYGETLIAYCLGYITAMKRKHITESDLNKLLSGTDAVLDSLFKFWKPPMRKIPPIIWIRIREELGSYLSEDIVGGELCFAWYHRQFWEAASRRYLTMNLASSGQYDRAAAIYASLANMSAGTLVLPIGGAVELYHDVRTQRNIAEFFDSGIWSWQPGSGPCDDTEAAKWYLRAAEQGDVESMKCIGAMYMQARGVEKDLELGLMWTLKAAQEGNPLAQYNMGWYCTYGLGVEKDESAAFDWYLRSAKNNVTWAMFQLGIMCEAGLGIEQNFKQAIEWHQRALKVDETNVWSENILGRTYLFGRGVDVDYDIAYEHFLKAAKTDNPQPNAQFYIGCFHFFGIGSFKVNEDLGFDWFLKAASRGFGKALCMVGYCYLTGRGTLQNREVAHDWLKSAVLQLDNPDDEWWMKELAGEFRLWSQNILDSPREADAVIEGEILNGLLASENQKTLRGSVGAFCVVDFVTAEEKTYKWI